MHKYKFLSVIIICITIINLVIPVHADDEIEDIGITAEEIKEILETSATTTEVPLINARNAVIFDRTSRQCFIWKK